MASNFLKRKLLGKVTIVTGGASGIGEATARIFIKHGARVVVISDIQSKKGRSVAKSIGSQHCSYVQCNVTDEEQVKSMVDWTATAYGGLDIMFSNAGTMSSSIQSILNLDFLQFDRTMRINTRGIAMCVKHAARKMVELGTRGAIVCTSSVAATRASPSATDYIMSKRAVLGLMLAASLQLGAHGIRVNSVSPALVLTPLARKMGFGTVDDVETAFGPLTSLKGVSLIAEHVAEAVAFLASDESAFVVGHDLLVDDGLVSLPFVKPA